MHLKRKKTLIFAVFCNLTVILLELIGFFARGSGIALSVFYTNDSNILALAAAVIWLIAFCCGNNPPHHWIMVLKYAAATCLGLTFLTVICFLAPLSGYRFMLFQGAMLYQHLLCPAFVLISFLFFEEYRQIKKNRYTVCSYADDPLRRNHRRDEFPRHAPRPLPLFTGKRTAAGAIDTLGKPYTRNNHWHCRIDPHYKE